MNDRPMSAGRRGRPLSEQRLDPTQDQRRGRQCFKQHETRQLLPGRDTHKLRLEKSRSSAIAAKSARASLAQSQRVLIRYKTHFRPKTIATDQKLKGERAGRLGPRLPCRPPGPAARVTRDPRRIPKPILYQLYLVSPRLEGKQNHISPRLRSAISTAIGKLANNSPADTRSRWSTRCMPKMSCQTPFDGNPISVSPQSAVSFPFHS